MFKTKKFLTILMLMLLCMVMLTGCGQFNISVDFDPNEKGLHDIRAQYITVENIYADVFYQEVKDYLVEKGFEVINEVGAGEGQGIMTYSVSKLSDDLDYDLQVLAGIANFLPSDEIIPINASYTDKHGLFVNKRELNVEVGLSTLSFRNVLTGMDDTNRAQINAMLKAFDDTTDYSLYSGNDWVEVVNQVARERVGILFNAVMKEEGFLTNQALFAEEEAGVGLVRPVWQMSPVFNEEEQLALVEPEGVSEEGGAVFNNKAHAVRETPNVVGISLISVAGLFIIVFIIVKFGILSKPKNGKKPKRDEFDDDEVKQDKEIKDEFIDFN